jgi:hypothetical protein
LRLLERRAGLGQLAIGEIALRLQDADLFLGRGLSVTGTSTIAAATWALICTVRLSMNASSVDS